MDDKKIIYNMLYGSLWEVDPNKLAQLNPNLKVTKIVHKISSDKTTTPVPNNVNSNTIEMSINQTLKVNNQPDSDINSINNDNYINVALNNNLDSTWDKLITEAKSCTKCQSICKTRKNIVFARGNKTAKYMFIGEYPTLDDDNSGIPFSGDAGELLNKMINAMKLDYETDVYICTALKCRPNNTVISTTELNNCRKYLLNQIALIQPKVIIAFGRIAMQSLVNINQASSKLREKIHYLELLTKQIPIIATYSPQYLLHNKEAKHETWHDLQLAIKIFNET